MIRVTVDLIPFGDEKSKKTIGLVRIINNLSSDDSTTGNYDVSFYGKGVEVFQLENFPRKEKDVWCLIKEALLLRENLMEGGDSNR